MTTCLFTDIELPDDTRVEHTLPRSLCGRFRSQRVTSNEFNQAPSGVDAFLHEPYRPILTYLSPLLSSEHRQAPYGVDMGEEEGRYLLAPGGELRLRGLRIDSRDESGRPIAISHEDPNELQHRAKQIGWPEVKAPVSQEPPSRNEIGYAVGVVVAQELEICALKSILLTFDHLLGGVLGEPHSFTRDAELTWVRTELKEAILDKQPPKRLLVEASLGLVYERLTRLMQFRFQHGPRQQSPFEHVLLACADAATRSLDLIWILGGFDPHAFRLPSQGPAFTVMAGAGMLHGEGSWGPIRLAHGISAGPATTRRSHPEGVAGERDAKRIVAEVAKKRHEAYAQAVYYTESYCDENVRSGIAASTRLFAGDQPQAVLVSKGLEVRLERLFGGHPDHKQVVAEAIARFLDGLPTNVREPTAGGQTFLSSNAVT